MIEDWTFLSSFEAFNDADVTQRRLTRIFFSLHLSH